MSSIWSLTGVVAAALLFSSCATAREMGPDGRPVYLAREVNLGPRLVGCTSYTPPTVAFNRALPVTVTFVVKDDGSVEPGSVRLGRPSTSDQTVQAEGLRIAGGCVYQPAMLAGEAVAVRLSRTFRIERAGTP